MKRWREFNYTGQWDGGMGLAYRPTINIELTLGEKTLPILALIDSGCDCIMVNKEIADAINLTSNPLKRVRVGGITGTRDDGFKFDVTVKIVGLDEFKTEATFVPGLPFACLLGQKGLFDSFNVRFEKAKRKFYLQPLV
jgi:hypothetical protein